MLGVINRYNLQMDKTFPKRLREARERLKLTQEDIASVCVRRNGNTISRAAVAQWESGDSYPTAEFLPGISKKLKVSIDWLFGLPPQDQGLSSEAMKLAAAWEQLPQTAKETVLHALEWSLRMDSDKKTGIAEQIIEIASRFDR